MARTTREKEAISTLRAAIKKNSLDGWKPKLTGRGKRFAGQTVYKTKEIQLSTKWLAKASTTTELINDTIFHEVAHALTPGDNHGPLWRETFTRLTGKKPRLHTMNKKTFTWQAVGRLHIVGKSYVYVRDVRKRP